MNAKVMIKLDIVYIHLFVMDFNHISGNADNPFDEILFRILRELKNYYISTFRVFDRDNSFVNKWNFDSINKLINKYVISDQECLLHGA